MTADSAMAGAGVVTAQGPDRWWACAAIQLGPAQPQENVPSAPVTQARPPTVHNVHSGHANAVVQAGQVFGDLHIHGAERPVPDDSAWLRSCWDAVAAAEAAVEMRYLLRPGEGHLDAFLIIRAAGADRAEAEGRVVFLRTQLGVLPGHVTATPVTDAARTRRVLEPFRPHDDGIVEIRKRLTVRRTSRDDAHSPWLTAVTPLTHQRRPWEPLWSELAALPCDTMLSVGLAPYRVGIGLHSHITARTAELARLAQDGPSPTSVWRVPRPPDDFAGAALPLMSDAARRYTDRAFVVRVSLAAERPIPGVLAELVADTISPRTPADGFAGAGPVVIRPTRADLLTAWHNATALNFAPLSAYDQGCPPEAIGDLERVLTAIVDLDEAAAAFRLPYRRPGQPSPFALLKGER